MIDVNKIKERVRMNPDDAEARWQYGCILAFTGQWEEAWPELEWRFKGNRYAMTKRAEYPKPTWQGEPGRLLVYQDQGYGDFIQYSRYLNLFKDHEVFVECQPALYNLMRESFKNVTWVLVGNDLPEHDYVVPICSMPFYFKQILSYDAYLVSPQSGKFEVGTAKKKIGIAWKGNPDYYDDGTRSCEPEEFLALETCGELISLMIQKCDLNFADFSMRLVDFADTAELISQLDCVVCVDTAVGHLAGALGKPVYLAIPYAHDWRWMASQKTTPWYPSMRLFRQPEAKDWKSVFKQIKEVL